MSGRKCRKTPARPGISILSRGFRIWQRYFLSATLYPALSLWHRRCHHRPASSIQHL